MRRFVPLLATVVLVALLAAACGGTGSASSQAPAASAASSAAATTATATTAAGKVDCTAIKKAGAQLIVGVQILAQIRTPETVQAVKDKVVGNFDPDTFIAAMQQLHALDGVSSPFGNPKTAIDNYIAAAQAAKDLLAKGSVSQADVDAYLTKVGTVTDFLGGQTAISGAMSTAGC